jgi:hypothetical protein
MRIKYMAIRRSKVKDNGTIIRVNNTNNSLNQVNINVVSTANVDNIYALFSSPNDKILNHNKCIIN